tara:strand:+ start:1203 stop:1913 length:711 start_codon:yes stop_codon:yes gene_type:complete
MASFNLGRFLEGGAYAILNEAIAELHSDDGMARPNRYEVLLTPPKGAETIMSQIMREFTNDGTVRKTGLRCSSISFPGRTIDTAPDNNIFGPPRNIAQGYTYGDLQASFQCSSDMKEKKVFETWQRLAYNPQSWTMGYYDDYTGSIDIVQLDEKDKKRYGVRIVECFPRDIAAQQLSYDTNNTIGTIDITFAYRYWKALDDEADLPKPFGERARETIGNVIERKITAAIPKVLSRL